VCEWVTVRSGVGAARQRPRRAAAGGSGRSPVGLGGQAGELGEGRKRRRKRRGWVRRKGAGRRGASARRAATERARSRRLARAAAAARRRRGLDLRLLGRLGRAAAALGADGDRLDRRGGGPLRGRAAGGAAAVSAGGAAGGAARAPGSSCAPGNCGAPRGARARARGAAGAPNQLTRAGVLRGDGSDSSSENLATVLGVLHAAGEVSSEAAAGAHDFWPRIREELASCSSGCRPWWWSRRPGSP
jgi:hypothetical protein